MLAAQEILFYILRLTIRPELDNLISAKTRLSTLYLGIRKTTNIATVSRKAPWQRCENELNKPYLNIFIGGLWEYNIQQLHYCDLFSLVWNLMDQLCLGCQCVSLETVRGEIGPRYSPLVAANQRQIWANLTNERTLETCLFWLLPSLWPGLEI